MSIGRGLTACPDIVPALPGVPVLPSPDPYRRTQALVRTIPLGRQVRVPHGVTVALSLETGAAEWPSGRAASPGESPVAMA